MSEGIPDSSVRRLSAYLRQLELLEAAGVEYVSSQQLAERMMVGAAQVRRDLTLFGQFGRPGVGYAVSDLIQRLRKILGTRQRQKVIVIGAGALCQALLRFPGFVPRGFELIAAFDSDPEKVGTEIAGIRVRAMERVAAVIGATGVQMAILTVPPRVAQEVADELIAAGVRGILNFAPVGLRTPENVYVTQVDITAHLEELSFQLSNEVSSA